MKTKTHFAFRVDVWDDTGDSIVEHVAGVDDFEVAEATYRAAVARWPATRITLRQGSRVVHDTGQQRRIDSTTTIPISAQLRSTIDCGGNSIAGNSIVIEYPIRGAYLRRLFFVGAAGFGGAGISSISALVRGGRFIYKRPRPRSLPPPSRR